MVRSIPISRSDAIDCGHQGPSNQSTVSFAASLRSRMESASTYLRGLLSSVKRAVTEQRIPARDASFVCHHARLASSISFSNLPVRLSHSMQTCRSPPACRIRIRFQQWRPIRWSVSVSCTTLTLLTCLTGISSPEPDRNSNKTASPFTDALTASAGRRLARSKSVVIVIRASHASPSRLASSAPVCQPSRAVFTSVSSRDASLVWRCPSSLSTRLSTL